MQPLFILPIATYLVLAAFLLWRSRKHGLEANGIADGAGAHQDTLV